MNPSEKPPALSPYERHVFVCTGPRCAPDTSQEIYQALKAKLKELKLDQKMIRRAQVNCFGLCQGGPILLVYPDGVWYHHVNHEKLDRIVEEHLVRGNPIAEWAFYPVKK